MVVAQVLLKFAGIHASIRFDMLHAFLGNPWLWSGLLASSVGMLCWLMTLRIMPLAMAYPWTALTYLLTPLVSILFFDDVLNAKYILGMASVVAGIFFTASGVEA